MIFDARADTFGRAGDSTGGAGANLRGGCCCRCLRQGGAAGIVHDFALPFAPMLSVRV